MAVLINGNGNEAIYAAQDADWYASIFGGTTAITGVGNQFAAEVLDANTIGVSDGVIITKEGRRIQLDVDEIDNFDIPNGGQGETNYYIIGYRLVTGGDSSQTAEEFVELMDSPTATIDEDTFRDGADSVYVSLYRIKQEGFTLTIKDALLPTVKSIIQLNNDLTELEGKLHMTPNYDDVLNDFTDSTKLSYTATKDGVIIGTYNCNGNSQLKINSKAVARYESGIYPQVYLPFKAGDVITSDAVVTSTSCLKAFGWVI